MAIADADGLDAVTIRAVAARLSVAPMTVYTHVPGKDELLDCMLDTTYLQMRRTNLTGLAWRQRVTAVADDNRQLHHAHPWTATVSTARPPLGPGQLAKYDHELRAFDGTGLDDVARDAALTFVLDFVRAVAVAEVEAATTRASSGVDDQQWWDTAGPLLADHVTDGRYPLASRVGAAAGQAHGSAHDAQHAYTFGLARVLDGLAGLIEPSAR